MTLDPSLRSHARSSSAPLRSGLALLAVLLIALASACAGGAGEEGAENGAADSDSDDYAEGMASEHAGEEPLPAFAGDQEGYDNNEITTREVTYATLDGNPVRGYLAMPSGAAEGAEREGAEVPGLLVIHEWWGLNDNLETMARLFAHHGYAALAVDLYGGEVADTPEAARGLMSSVDEERATDNLRQAQRYLAQELNVSRQGVIGWCFGGGWSLNAALAMPETLDAAVIYYGHLEQDRERLAGLNLPLLGIFGAEDQGIPVAGVREFEATLQDLGKDVEIHLYEGAGHAFANPSGQRYQPEAAKDAWDKTLAFLDRELKG